MIVSSYRAYLLVHQLNYHGMDRKRFSKEMWKEVDREREWYASLGSRLTKSNRRDPQTLY